MEKRVELECDGGLGGGVDNSGVTFFRKKGGRLHRSLLSNSPLKKCNGLFRNGWSAQSS